MKHQVQLNNRFIIPFSRFFFSPPTQVPVTSWFDDPNDTELLDLIPFFEGLNKVDNVLTILGQNQTFQSPVMNTVSTDEEGQEQE